MVAGSVALAKLRQMKASPSKESSCGRALYTDCCSIYTCRTPGWVWWAPSAWLVSATEAMLILCLGFKTCKQLLFHDFLSVFYFLKQTFLRNFYVFLQFKDIHQDYKAARTN